MLTQNQTFKKMKVKRQKSGKPVKNHFVQEYIKYRRRVNAQTPENATPIASFRIDCQPLVTFFLNETKKSVCVGTLPGCNEGRIFVGEDYMIDKIHCQFVLVKTNPGVQGCNYTTFVRDISFNSSTFVNNKRVGYGQSMELHGQDMIRIGEHPDKSIKIRYSNSEFNYIREKMSLKYQMPDPLRNYTVRSEESLGKGAHGIVMNGFQNFSNGEVACKYIFRESMSQELYDRISEEANIISKLKHENIVVFYDSWKGPERTIIILEHMTGGSLQSFINQDQIKFDDWTDLARQICGAIQYMHENGYMHRDIKASNVMFSDRTYKVVKLIDFGLTKSFTKAEKLGDPIEYTATGTIAYMSCEIAQGLLDGKRQCHYTCAVDMWSFGILNYHALTGHLPFTGEDNQVLGSIVSDEINYSPLLELNLQCAVDFISGLCQKDPESRLTASQAMEHAFFSEVKQ
ncbi:kinase-like domain-containing protein [Gigaspora rosea]|uniref:non-specific serine/threonine protein kinase n=1 Tax=Gigaspora rosea TaxID=44941 RepID=A0A397VFP8_9GLOM|nr:kinase-like domain-containing protein [Gigaspora rosea]